MILQVSYNTPYGYAKQIGINLYKVTSGYHVGYVLEKIPNIDPKNVLWRVLRVECPTGFSKVNRPFEGDFCEKNILVSKVVVTPVNGNGSLPSNGNSNTYVDSNGELKTNTNWLLYGAIAFGAYILLKG